LSVTLCSGCWQSSRQPESSAAEMRHLSEADLLRFCSEIFSKEPMYEVFVNEARFGLSRVLPRLRSLDLETAAVLEVGGGSCILSAYLASKRLHVTVVEPLGYEFDFFADLQNRVLDFCRDKSIALNMVRITGEELNLIEQFDMAFTINALEHMKDPLLAIDKLYNSLKPGGILLAHCPNYAVPFDSHFNLILITRSKRVNEWLYRSKIERSPGIWKELNFLRYVDVQRHLARRGVAFAFDCAVMHDLVERLLEDPIFAQRMPLIVRAIGATLRYSGLVRALTLVPARFQTPMEVVIRRDDWAATSGAGGT
jgi:SAM-dependent methyltransferase